MNATCLFAAPLFLEPGLVCPEMEVDVLPNTHDQAIAVVSVEEMLAETYMQEHVAVNGSFGAATEE